MWKSVLSAAVIASLASAADAQDQPRVVAVNQMLHDMAARLLDGDAEVVFPVPDDVDPSFWRPSISDISTIQAADLILLNGAGFASWIDRVSLPRARVVNTSSAIEDQFIVTESITHSHGDGGAHSHEGLASYTWLDPMLAMAQAEAIAYAVVARDLAPADEVEARLAELTSDLTELDASTQDALRAANDVAMIATHPRYQYFARRYGVSIASLEWDAGAMPSEAQLADLSTLAQDLRARVLIWEAQPPTAAIEAAEALGLNSVVFEPWAGGGTHDTFIDAFSEAVAGLSDAVSHSSN